MNRKVVVAAGLVTMLLMAGCAAPEIADWPTESWPTSTPQEQGIDASRLDDMVSELEAQNPGVDSVTIVRHGYLVLDEYFSSAYGQDDVHRVFSCTKSVASTLIGIAIEQGYIDSVDVPLLSFFPDEDIQNLDAQKEAITLEHVLMMGSGLDCQDSYLYRWQGLEEMQASSSWSGFVLDLPMAHEPGTYFEYCNGGSHLLTTILQKATGMTALDFANENLFGPLGITNLEWAVTDEGVNWGYSGLQIRPQDMAKFGYLALRGGEWDGEQIVPEMWLETATSPQLEARTLSDHYGYQWWISDDDYYLAIGYMGQFIVVVPDRDLVVVFTSSLDDADFYYPINLLNEYILPAAR